MTYIYKSGLKSYILGLITQKRADGLHFGGATFQAT